jgi:hypothetical protein
MAPAAPKTSNISLTMTNPRKFGHVTGLLLVWCLLKLQQSWQWRWMMPIVAASSFWANITFVAGDVITHTHTLLTGSAPEGILLFFLSHRGARRSKAMPF